MGEFDDRSRGIIRAGIVSIVVNILLAASKGLIGIVTNSISITLDAVNNFSDAISGIVTTLGAKLSVKEPNKKHPLGYGRIEYISAMIVAGLIFYAGVTSAIESIKRIITPTVPSYSKIYLLVLGIFVVVKILLSKYMTSKGKKLDSMSLIASGKDAGFDGILSLSVIVAIIIYLTTGLLLEAYIGIIISIIIIKASVEMMVETIDEILGNRVDKDLSEKIKNEITKHQEVLGVYDLIINSYGPNMKIASLHIEVPDTMTADEIDIKSREIADEIYKLFGVLLTGIGIYAKNTKSKEIEKTQSDIEEMVMSHKGILQIHAFYMDLEKKFIVFDIIIDYNISDRDGLYREVLQEIKSKYPTYSVYMNMDIDI